MSEEKEEVKPDPDAEALGKLLKLPPKKEEEASETEGSK